MNRNVLVTLLICLPLMSIGCAATQVKQTWVDETYRGGKPEKVLIIAMISTPTVQREIESRFARRFRDRGITATEGFRIIPVEQLPAHDARDVVVAKVRELKVDAVLIVRRAVTRTTEDHIPGMTIAHGMGGGTSAVVWSSAPTAPTTQAYSHDTEFLGMEAQLYDAQTEKLIWFLQTETRLTGPPQEGIEPYVSLVARKLFSAKPFH
jgi:hypothetical protein